MKRTELILMMLLVPLDAVMLLLAAVSAYVLRFSPWAVSLKTVQFDLSRPAFLEIAIPVALLWMLMFALFGLYQPQWRRSAQRELARIFAALFAGLSLVALYLVFTLTAFDSRFLLLVSVLIALVYVSAGRMFLRFFARLLRRFGIGLRRVALIGTKQRTVAIASYIAATPRLGYQVVGMHNSSAALKKAYKPDTIDEIIYLDAHDHLSDMDSTLQFAFDKHLDMRFSADIASGFPVRSDVQPLSGVPLSTVMRTPLDGWGRIMKRLMDIFLGLFFLILLSPVYFVIMFGILVETGRPIIYHNERVGVRKKLFILYKFRSMYQKDSTGKQFGSAGKTALKKEESLIKAQSTKGGPIYKIANDPRVTKFGKLLRRWSLDELPQFWNVVKGDMSLVGPRPHQEREVNAYDDSYKQVFAIKPGITGLSQISGRSDLSYEEEMRLDLLYIERWSLFTDLIIIIKTPVIMLLRKGSIT